MDLVPELELVVYREGESPEAVKDIEVEDEDLSAEDFAELQAELDEQDAEAALQEEIQEDSEALDVGPDESSESIAEAVEDEELAEMNETEIQIDEDQSSQEGASEEE
jgi:hypothetical protein